MEVVKDNKKNINISISEQESKIIEQKIKNYDVSKEEFIGFLNRIDLAVDDNKNFISDLQIPSVIINIAETMLKNKIKDLKREGLL